MKIGAGLFTFLFAVSQVFTPFPVYAAEEKFQGVDVSVWQGDIDFTKVKEGGKDIVYIRAGYGTSEDKNFRGYAVSAKKADLNIGFYFYVTALTVDEAKKQARYFASLIDDYTYDCLPAVDFEQFSGFTKEETNEITIAFIETLAERTNTTPLFYSSSYRTTSLWEDTLKRYPLWVASYNGGVSPETGIWQQWVGYQYSSKGEVSGISGNVDLDYFTEDVFLDKPFKDMHSDDWFYKAVLGQFNKGLVAGISTSQFGGKEKAHRTMAVTLLYRLEGRPPAMGSTDFKDVTSGKWYSESVLWAEENKIAMGYKDNFYPEKGATREEMCTLLYRYAKFKGYDVTLEGNLGFSNFEDAKDVEKWAEEALKWGVDRGIVKGTSVKTLSPKEIVSRAQMAVMVDRFIAEYKI